MFSFKSFAIVSIVLILTIVIQANAAATTKAPKCLLPKEPGPCRMSLNRFYYNSLTDTCEEFVYGGCKGNDNKFGFKETCETECKTSISTTTPMTPIPLSISTLKSMAQPVPVTIKDDAKSTIQTSTTKPQVTVKH